MLMHPVSILEMDSIRKD